MYVNLHDEVVLVESCLPSRDVQWLLEGTGRLVVFRGHGGAGMLAMIHSPTLHINLFDVWVSKGSRLLSTMERL